MYTKYLTTTKMKGLRSFVTKRLTKCDNVKSIKKRVLIVTGQILPQLLVLVFTPQVSMGKFRSPSECDTLMSESVSSRTSTAVGLSSGLIQPVPETWSTLKWFLLIHIDADDWLLLCLHDSVRCREQLTYYKQGSPNPNPSFRLTLGGYQLQTKELCSYNLAFNIKSQFLFCICVTAQLFFCKLEFPFHSLPQPLHIFYWATVTISCRLGTHHEIYRQAHFSTQHHQVS